MGNPKRLPQVNDFPPSFNLTITPPTGSSCANNSLILLHGLGDSETSFTDLARSLSLPATVSISLRGPHPIPPFLTGSDSPAFHWSDDLLFDELSGAIDGDAGFSRAIEMIDKVVGVLEHECGFPRRNILILGYGQGAMAILGYIMRAEERGKSRAFGGVIAIGGGLPREILSWVPPTAGDKLTTPILVCGGCQDTYVTRNVVKALKDRLVDVSYVKWNRRGDAMPRNREEMFPVMQFFGRRLSGRVPEGTVELSLSPQ